MAALRESALLPTIKCSSCGLQVEISQMGDHLCSEPAAESSPPPHNDERFDHQPSNPASEKHGRLPAPVDTGAANRAFLNQWPTTTTTTTTTMTTTDHSANVSPSGTPPYLRRPGESSLGQGPGLGVRPSTAGKPIGEALMERMNGMTPGPFEASRRPSFVGDTELPARSASLTKSEESRDDSFKDRNWFGTSYSNPPSAMNCSLSTPKQPTRGDYEGFGPPPTPRSAEISMTLPGRSETYPKPSTSTVPELLRQPTMPSPHSALLPPMNMPTNRRPSLSPDTSRRPPPRTSLIPHDVDPSAVDLAAEFGSSNPYHAPSESSSSGFSTCSSQSHASSQSSVTRSEFGEDYGGDDGKYRADHLGIATEPFRPANLRIDPNAPMRSPSVPPSPYTVSPRDMRPPPSLRAGPGPDGYRPYTRPLPSPQLEASLMDDIMPKRSITPPQRKVSPDPSNASSRGECKACRKAITGKSVSSADGRLTGKYHKACFVCTTCSQAFSSAEFYVLDDRPYCEQHYHKLNGSLCGGCGRGIEGQYVEDESRIKRHVDCFRCPDCGLSLSEGYFEVEGKAYCERDALRRSHPWPQHPPSPGHSVANGYGPRPYAPGPRGHGGPPGRPMGPGGPGRRPSFEPPAGPLGMGAPGGQRGAYGGHSPGRLGAGMGAGSKPMMNKRMTRIGIM